MKVLIVNYRYFISGGPERYLFNITEVLEKHGHTVIPFSIKHNRNAETSYADYFMEPVGSGDEVYAHEYGRKNIRTVWRVISRMLYSFEAKKKLKRMIREFRPDIVYVLYYQNKMSASVIDAAWEMNVPVVQRISDFNHICVNNSFYHYGEKKICERCLHGSRFNAIRYKCVNHSRVNSFLKVLSLKIQDIRKTRKKIAAFVIPAGFTGRKFMEYGIPEKKIHCIPTFFNASGGWEDRISYGDFFLYVGRVDQDKGILTLVKAFENTPYKLVIIGASMDGYDETIKQYLAGKKHNITFTGRLDFSEIRSYLGACLCTICPSECYDNMPNSVLESYAFEKGVIASRLGPLADMVNDLQTGMLFTAGDPEELRSSIKYCYENRSEVTRFGKNGKLKLLSDYSEQYHYEHLIRLFNSVTNGTH